MTKKPPKVHQAVELLSNLSSAAEKAASQKVETRVQEMEVKTKELAASKARAEADVMLKYRELDMMKKNGIGEQKKTVELNMLILKERKKLLLTRKRLMDAWVEMDKIDSIQPVK
jgi:hypothetical protein